MSFEALISLILFLLFVIVPALGGNRKKPDSDPKRQQPPAGTDRRGQTQQTGTSQQTQKAEPATDSWEARLREARRRIEEAMGETSLELPQDAPRTGPPAPPRQAAAPAARPARPPVSRPPTTTAGRKPPARPDANRAAPARSAGVSAAESRRIAAERTRRLRESSSTELQVTRLDSPRPYTGRRRRNGARNLFGQDSLQSGLVWHQVLSEPPHRRGRRRTSRLRSP